MNILHKDVYSAPIRTISVRVWCTCTHSISLAETELNLATQTQRFLSYKRRTILKSRLLLGRSMYACAREGAGFHFCALSTCRASHGQHLRLQIFGKPPQMPSALHLSEWSESPVLQERAVNGACVSMGAGGILE